MRRYADKSLKRSIIIYKFVISESENSKRILLQATYTPIKSTDEKSGKPAMVAKRPFDKLNLIRSVKPTQSEVDLIRNSYNNKHEKSSSHKEFVRAIKTIESAVADLERPNVLHNVALFSEVDSDTLLNIVDDIVKLRQKESDYAIKALDSLFLAYKKNNNNNTGLDKSPQQQQSDEEEILANRNQTKTVSSSSPQYKKGQAATANPGKNIDLKSSNMRGRLDKPLLISPSEIKLDTLMDWTVENNVGEGAAMQVMELAERSSIPRDGLTVGGFASKVRGTVVDAEETVKAFRERLKTEPIGYLHLERLSFTPVGIERGELVYSVPLSPGEEVNITHREWSNTSEEFQRIVTDYMENYSEEGVTEKTDLAQSSNSQQQHTDGYNLSVTASGGYGPVNITASAGYNASNSSSNSAQLSRTHGMTVTRKASSRVRQEHKTSFKVASASGTEDQAVRKIKNPFMDKASRTDYYQLLRKWRVDLSRYGLRLTYDITIPEPGRDLLSKIEEITKIKRELNIENSFTLKLEEINESNYLQKAAEFGAVVDRLVRTKTVTANKYSGGEGWSTLEASKANPAFEAILVEIGDDYEIESGSFTLMPVRYADHVGSFWISYSADKDTGDTYSGIFSESLKGRTGDLTLFYTAHSYHHLGVTVDFNVKQTDVAYKIWQSKVWNILKEANQANYETHRQMLQKRLDQLNEELRVTDPLGLRKVEREEVMKGVMRWLFGPYFTFSPADIPSDLYYDKLGSYYFQAVKNEDIWRNVILQGEIIKFVHHAIEWENMLYFLYPYFWSHKTRWDEKKDLEHPDIMHKVFLKSGSARVVLTIRPGFEKAFVSFIESAGTGTLLPNQPTPYLPIAKEMENYAKTNYPGIPTANPDSDPRPLLLPEQQRAWKEMQDIMKLLDKYHETYPDKGYPEPAEVYPKKPDDPTKPIPPSVLEEFVEGKKPHEKPHGVPGIHKVPRRDPWGNDYVYKYPGTHGDYDLMSYGAKGKDGGGPALKQDGTPNENAYITSWAESSLIGTWYEYTPTSALDITFNEKLPGA